MPPLDDTEASIVARAAGGPPQPPRQTLIAVIAETVADLAGKFVDFGSRLTALEARPMARDGRAGRDGRSINGIRVDDNGHLRIIVDGVENDLGKIVGPPGEPGASIRGQDGAPGRDGASIAGVRLNDRGHLVVSVDEVESDLGRVTGEPGRGILRARAEGDALFFTYSDGSEERVAGLYGNVAVAEPESEILGVQVDQAGHLQIRLRGDRVLDAGLVRGAAGKDGQSVPGKDGRGIAAALIDADGRLVLNLTDGEQVTLPRVVGRDGIPGLNGAPGRDGQDANTGSEMSDAQFARKVTGLLGFSVQIGENQASE